jgi:4,5-DOPA dioxygenase extradiol
MAERMPALFIGHGNPMNALLVNPYTQRWAGIGAALPRPKAILSVSAHWYIEDAAVTVSTAPRTIHDFGGFPRELYQVQYPAPGDPSLASRIQKSYKSEKHFSLPERQKYFPASSRPAIWPTFFL